MIVRMLLPALALAWSASASAEWRKATSDNFIVYGDISDEGLHRFTQELERFDQLLRAVTNIDAPPLPRKFTVYVAQSDVEVRRLTGQQGTALAGLYTAPLGGARAIVPFKKTSRNAWGLDGLAILRHEYVHHFMFQYAPAAYPFWYQEGFAEYYSTATFKDAETAIVGAPVSSRAAFLKSFLWTSFDNILSHGSEGLVAGEEHLYAQGWLLVHAMSSNPELRGKLTDYLTRVSQGTSPADASRSVFGDADAALSKPLQAYMDRKRLPALQVKLRSPRPASIRPEPMSPGEAALISLGIKFSYVTESDLPALARTIRSQAAQYSADPFALELLARVALVEKKYEEADGVADKLLALDATSSAGMRLKGIALARRASESKAAEGAALWRQARTFLVKANATDPDNPQILYSFYRTYADQEVTPPANASEALLRAFELYPQNPELRYVAAADLERRGRLQEAIAVLKPLVYDPHGSDKGELTAMLKRIQAAAGKTKTAS